MTLPSTSFAISAGWYLKIPVTEHSPDVFTQSATPLPPTVPSVGPPGVACPGPDTSPLTWASDLVQALAPSASQSTRASNSPVSALNPPDTGSEHEPVVPLHAPTAVAVILPSGLTTLTWPCTFCEHAPLPCTSQKVPTCNCG